MFILFFAQEHFVSIQTLAVLFRVKLLQAFSPLFVFVTQFPVVIDYE